MERNQDEMIEIGGSLRPFEFKWRSLSAVDQYQNLLGNTWMFKYHFCTNTSSKEGVVLEPLQILPSENMKQSPTSFLSPSQEGSVTKTSKTGSKAMV